eukprot:1605128-Alexandrium_andersonii.AAC.1
MPQGVAQCGAPAVGAHGGGRATQNQRSRGHAPNGDLADVPGRPRASAASPAGRGQGRLHLRERGR